MGVRQETRPAARVSPRRRLTAGSPWPPVVLVGVVVGLGLIPVLGDPAFYYWDDTAGVFAPTWRAVGLDLLQGRWPTLRPDVWMGGNWAAEAQFGLWNPVNLLLCVGVALLPDLAVAATLVKLCAMAALSLGGYLLMREYGARPWVAAGVASALPFGGFTLYFDAATWVAGLFAFAWTPWFWWVSRRCLLGAINPGWVYVMGYLILTNGNPYGALAAVVVLSGLAVEAFLTGNRAGLGRLVLAGACIGTTAGVAYLPMFLTADVGWRGEGAGVVNDGVLAPDLTMLVGTSSPSLLPLVRVWEQEGSSMPITYTTWFLVPLLPWLRWETLRTGRRPLASVLVVAAVFLALVLGPSSLWLFRWPIRLVQYVFLALAVLVAVVASRGYAAGAHGVRLGVSLTFVVAGGWAAVASRPDLLGRHATATGVVAALALGLAWAATRRPGALPAILAGGTAVVLGFQVAWVPVNLDVVKWRFPTAVDDLAEFDRRYASPVLQLAHEARIPADDRPAAWSEMLFGSTAAAVGAESTSSYTGIGFNEFSRTLCLNHAGTSCPQAFPAVWSPAGTTVPVAHLVDALKTRTVVVQNALVPDAAAAPLPDNWVVADVTDRVTVFERTDAVPWPGSRLAATTAGVDVVSAVGTDTTERVVLRTGASGGAVQFARLAWPGYAALVDGRAVEVRRNAQGLIELGVPAGLDAALVQLEFRPPGYEVAIPLLLVGVGAAAAQSALFTRAARPRRLRRGLD